MNISELLTDTAILSEVGSRIARYRLDNEMTQAQLAEQAGVSKRTVERVESGASVQFSTIVRILRVLELAKGLDRMIPEPAPRPLALLKQKGRVRKRASSKRSVERSPEEWTWGDDT